jgi:hypothetical protein
MATLDAVVWHHMTFIRTAKGWILRVWFEGNEPRMERLFADDPEYQEPIRELRQRERAEATR